MDGIAEAPTAPAAVPGATPDAAPKPEAPIQEHLDYLRKQKKGEGPKGPKPVVDAKVSETPSEPKGEAPETAQADTVTYKGKSVPVQEFIKDPEILKQAKFELKANGKVRQVTGEELLQKASLGITATEKMTIAKEAVERAQQIINEREKELASAKGVDPSEAFNKVMDLFVSQAEDSMKPGAVELANHLKGLFAGVKGTSVPTEKPEPKEVDTDKLIEEKVRKALEETSRKQDEEKKYQETVTSAREGLKKAVLPFMHHFSSDGKLNTDVFEGYYLAVQKTAANAWKNAGSVQSASEISKHLENAAKTVFEKYKPLLAAKDVPGERPQTPAIRPSSGAGLPSTPKESPKFRTYLEQMAWEREQERAQRK